MNCHVFFFTNNGKGKIGWKLRAVVREVIQNVSVENIVFHSYFWAKQIHFLSAKAPGGWGVRTSSPPPPCLPLTPWSQASSLRRQTGSAGHCWLSGRPGLRPTWFKTGGKRERPLGFAVFSCLQLPITPAIVAPLQRIVEKESSRESPPSKASSVSRRNVYPGHIPLRYTFLSGMCSPRYAQPERVISTLKSLC